MSEQNIPDHVSNRSRSKSIWYPRLIKSRYTASSSSTCFGLVYVPFVIFQAPAAFPTRSLKMCTSARARRAGSRSSTPSITCNTKARWRSRAKRHSECEEHSR
eukprot:1435107-Prymnesium_polylepis.1